MSLLVLYFTSAAVFLVADAIALRFVMGPLFERHVGEILYDSPRVGPAAIFYLFYVAVLVWVVAHDRLEGGLGSLAFNAALFGAAAYGTYEFTNLSTIRGWSMQMVAADVAWGAVLSAFSLVVGVIVTRAVT